MSLASVSAQGRGETDRLLTEVVTRLRSGRVNILGALRAPHQGDGHCNSDLWLLPDGPTARITQDLGAGSTACRMDAGALEEAVGLVAARLAAEPVDIVVLNKFGLSEAEGRGFRPFIAEVLARGIPVLIGVSDTHRAAFERFSDGIDIALPADREAILAWCHSAIAPGTADVFAQQGDRP